MRRAGRLALGDAPRRAFELRLQAISNGTRRQSIRATALQHTGYMSALRVAAERRPVGLRSTCIPGYWAKSTRYTSRGRPGAKWPRVGPRLQSRLQEPD